MPHGLTVLVLVTLLSAQKTGAQASDSMESADALFKAGKFPEAEAIYAKVAAGDPRNQRAPYRLGRIALFSNRFKRAEDWLKKALEIEPGYAAAKLELAECYYRQDDFAKAIPLLRATGQQEKAKKLERLADKKPYEIEGSAATTSLDLILTDPLPLVRVRVNNKVDVNFTVDTGASEVVLDPELAKQVGVETFGALTGTFAGGKQAQVLQGKLDSIALGDITVKNIPVTVLDTRRLSKPIFGGKQVDGILGTILFYHFLATLDYPHHKLMLAKKTPENLDALESRVKSPGTHVVPFWMAGDHYIVSWAKVERTPPVLLFVDTGLAGGGVTLAKSVIDQAGIKLMENQAGEGIGGGGKVRVVPFVVKELSLGDVKGKNIVGLMTAAFPLEDRFGFRIGGIISHGFFRPYGLTFDFTKMRLVLNKEPRTK